jgi:hypothetical protein
MNVYGMYVQPGTEILADTPGPIAAARWVIALGLERKGIRPVDQAVIVDVVVAVSFQFEAIVLQLCLAKSLNALIVRDLWGGPCVQCVLL